MKRKSLFIVSIFIFFIILFACNNKVQAVQNGWEQDWLGRWYYLENGEVKTGWLYWNGNWYYLGFFGDMVSGGKYNIDGKYYRFHSDGRMYCNEIYKSENIGTLLDGTTSKYCSSIEYYNSSGYSTKLSIGWYKSGKDWYYVCDENGIIYHGRSVKIGNKYWLFKSTGEWVDLKGWYSIKVNQYDNYGKPTGTTDDWYYSNKSDGSLCTNEWVFYKNIWYYIDNNGKMACNSAILYSKDNKYYGVDKDGKMITNKWLGISINSGFNGYYTQWYYFGNDGKGVTGWKNDGGWYYLENGQCIRNTVRYFADYDKSYAFDFNGRMVDKKGWTIINMHNKDYYGWAYVKDSSGECYRDFEWLNIGGYWYSFNSSGEMFKDQRIYFAEEYKYYEFDKDGHLIG